MWLELTSVMHVRQEADFDLLGHYKLTYAYMYHVIKNPPYDLL